MNLLQGKLSSRVYDDLQRAFYRTLGEFKRHQTWRRAQRVVDVDTFDPEPEPVFNLQEVSGEQGNKSSDALQIEQVLI
jgi:hypothetical protein